MNGPWDILKLLSDPTRLRLLLLLWEEELSVAELQEILDMGQSRISSHLALLRKASIVNDRKEGKRAYYTLSSNLTGKTLELLGAVRDTMKDHPDSAGDAAGLKRILERRQQLSERYFNEVAGRLSKNYCPGRSWQAIGHFLLHLTPRIRIADLGAGEGVLAQLLAQRAQKVYCIDNSPRMVEVGTQLAAENGFDNLEYRLGDIENIPLSPDYIDLAYLSQALHHAPHPQKAIDEAYRILHEDGMLIILDLKEHQFEKARELYADLWLGFKENHLYQMLEKAGFRNIQVSTVAKEEQPPFFETIMACGTKP